MSGSVITVANSKGGTGKSSIAINLLQHIQFDLVIDADTTHFAISSLLKLSNTNTVEVKIPICEQDILEWCSEGKKVLIDCGGFDSVFAQIAISQSDVVITPTNDDPTEQFGLSQFNKVMSKVSKIVDEKMIAKVLITKVHPSRRDFSLMEAYVSGLEHLELLPVVIPFSALIPKAQFSGEGVKNGSIAAKFSMLAKHINKLCDER